MSDVSKTSDLIERARDSSWPQHSSHQIYGPSRVWKGSLMETNEELITLARRLPELFQEAQLGETRYLEEDDMAALDATGYAAVAVAQKLADALESATRVPVQGEPNDELELVDVVLTTADIEQLAHLLVQLSPATQKNSGATVRRLMQEMNIKEVEQ